MASELDLGSLVVGLFGLQMEVAAGSATKRRGPLEGRTRGSPPPRSRRASCSSSLAVRSGSGSRSCSLPRFASSQMGTMDSRVCLFKFQEFPIRRLISEISEILSKETDEDDGCVVLLQSPSQWIVRFQRTRCQWPSSGPAGRDTFPGSRPRAPSRTLPPASAHPRSTSTSSPCPAT